MIPNSFLYTLPFFSMRIQSNLNCSTFHHIILTETLWGSLGWEYATGLRSCSKPPWESRDSSLRLPRSLFDILTHYNTFPMHVSSILCWPQHAFHFVHGLIHSPASAPAVLPEVLQFGLLLRPAGKRGGGREEKGREESGGRKKQ